MATEKISFTVSLEVQIEEREGWYHATSSYGQSSSHSKRDCLRIIKERVMDKVGRNNCR